MTKFFTIDFSGSCDIEAETEEEAAKKFWRYIGDNFPLPANLYDIENIYETED